MKPPSAAPDPEAGEDDQWQGAAAVRCPGGPSVAFLRLLPGFKKIVVLMIAGALPAALAGGCKDFATCGPAYPADLRGMAMR
jgi:hypothetical protein